MVVRCLGSAWTCRGEHAPQFAGDGVDDADAEVLDEHEHAGSCVGSADADGVEGALVAQGDLAADVDAVVADPVVGVGAAVAGECLGAAGVEGAEVADRLAYLAAGVAPTPADSALALRYAEDALRHATESCGRLESAHRSVARAHRHVAELAEAAGSMSALRGTARVRGGSGGRPVVLRSHEEKGKYRTVGADRRCTGATGSEPAPR